MLDDFQVGDLVEVVSLVPINNRALAGSSQAITNGDRGIVIEKYSEDFRVQCGSNATMQWEANMRADEVRFVARLGREEATRRLTATV